MKKIVLVFTILVLLVNCSGSKKDNNNGMKVTLNNLNDTISLINYDHNGFIDGEYRKYTNGVVDSVLTYKHGIKQGSFEIFYPNGILKEEGLFDQGKKQGWITEYYPSGRIQRKTEYINYSSKKDSYENQTIVYDKNGDVNFDESALYVIGLLEKYSTDTSSCFKVRVQLYSFVQKEKDAQFLLTINKNDSEEYRLNMAGKYNKRDFIIPINKNKDSMMLKGYIKSKFRYNKKDSTYNEIIHAFNFKLSQLNMFKDIIHPSMTNPPVDYDTLEIK